MISTQEALRRIKEIRDQLVSLNCLSSDAINVASRISGVSLCLEAVLKVLIDERMEYRE